jgi:hypothetical protein
MSDEIVVFDKKFVDPEDFRNAIIYVESQLKEKPQVEIQTRHYFSNGMYAREIFIPKGTVLTGAIHKTEHLCVMHGDLEISSEFGNTRLTGYHMFSSSPGIKRIGYAHEDTYFTSLHPTDLTDVKELEQKLVCYSYDDYTEFLLEQEKTKFLKGDTL